MLRGSVALAFFAFCCVSVAPHPQVLTLPAIPLPKVVVDGCVPIPVNVLETAKAFIGGANALLRGVELVISGASNITAAIPSECKKAAADKLEPALTELNQTTRKCLGRFVGDVQTSLKEFQRALFKTLTLLPSTGLNIGACLNRDTPVKCLSDLVEKTTNDISNLPGILATTYNNLTRDLLDLRSARACVESAGNVAAINIAGALEEVLEQCAAATASPPTV